ncbi:MAG: DUF262 domain-containing protein [Mesorhizobium sp.]|uniref:GmrSD restriction endonuclease domain-containing protein n=1 Tax=Mesorhizobium sp. TaxID=1871066 RepID=UPI0012120A2D|nr:DUF262 domain-containing protein [Mesorhizobium sp.]TIL94646.1 MAG: DUF262 domain-containing protein [Mesorhizobium sp.]
MADTLFKKVDYTLASLVDSIANGQIGLPDIQRPFVWKNVKVRDLFDSMYRGYPIGYLLFWETGVTPGTRQIGTDQKQLAPTRVIVDGQQRLTSLFAVIKSIKVLRENFASEAIEIAFNPLDGKFEVPDAAIIRDKRFIPSISAIWDAKRNPIQFANEYIAVLKQHDGELTPDQVNTAQTALGRLHSLLSFPFTVLEIDANVEAQQVADIFVRINSEGKKLNQADFILTLMSVFWDEGRRQLENFCRQARLPGGSGPSAFNHLFRPSPDQMLRVAIAVGFRRARLAAVYAILRGRVQNDDPGASNREDQFGKLKNGQVAALQLQCWHDFLKVVTLAGFRSPNIISSENALVFAYSFYLIGRREFGVEEHRLRKAIAKWFFMSGLSGRFTSSPESKMEFDLARLRLVKTADEFLAVIDTVCSEVLTNDFWSITLPGDLANSAGQSPSMFAYFAALNVLDARVLFSDHKVKDLMDPSVQGNRASLERHHLFPVAYLKSQGVTDKRDYNQIANFAIVEWGDNTKIAANAPTTYVPALEQRFGETELNEMYRHHALPRGWETMSFPDFLKVRRGMMAQTIKAAYEALAGANQAPLKPPSVQELISAGETDSVEFKSTLRTNLHTKEKDPKIELMVLKTVAGFLNAKGGTLVVGVADDGSPVGLDVDGFPNEDKLSLHLINLLTDRIGGQHAINVHPRFDDHDGVRVLVVGCEPAKTAVWLKDGTAQRFFVRYGPSTQELAGASALDYVKQRFS